MRKRLSAGKGSGAVSGDQESPGQIDLEWTDFERRRRTYYKAWSKIIMCSSQLSCEKIPLAPVSGPQLHASPTRP